MTSDQKENPSWLKTLGMVGNLGFQIAIPLVVLAFAGRMLDQRFNSSPWLLLAGIFLSLVITSFLLLRKMKAIMKGIEGSQNEKQHHHQTDQSS